MNEFFLHFIWQHYLQGKELQTTAGEQVEILSPGFSNADAGPDFFNAKIRINDTVWIGNVEIHIISGDWYQHKHHLDPAYNNVILHVVYRHNKTVKNEAGNVLPEIEMHEFVTDTVYEMYTHMILSSKYIPCAGLIDNIPPVYIHSGLQGILIKCLLAKKKRIDAMLVSTYGNWEEICFRLTARYFGAGVNREPFEMLARNLPYTLIQRKAYDDIFIDALVFGQAGLLSKRHKDDYPQQLLKDYCLIKDKYSLHPMNAFQWKYGRLRPQNFPDIRLAQFAAFIRQARNSFANILETTSIECLRQIFMAKPSEYWGSHYAFQKKSKLQNKTIGIDHADLLIINVVVPLKFTYGVIRGKTELKDEALRLLELIHPEKNSILKNWKKLGLDTNSAADSQALIFLKKQFCDKRKCLECHIGKEILKRN